MANHLTYARFLIWIGSDQEKTFGPKITSLIHKHIEPERMVLWDSKKRGGRPDTIQLLKETWTSFGAEVIFSNKQGNNEMMQGCREGMLFRVAWSFLVSAITNFLSWVKCLRHLMGILILNFDDRGLCRFYGVEPGLSI